jgi:acetyltransferase
MIMKTAQATPPVLTTSWNLLTTHSVTIRPMDIDDLAMEIDFLERLTMETRHKRFLGPAIQPATSLGSTARPMADQLALAASITWSGGEEILGIACYAGDIPGEADFAMVIADAWQGCGIGRKLLSHLRDCAHLRGIKRLSGDVLADNRPMLSLSSSLGFEICAHPDGALLRRVTGVLRS